MRTENSTYFDDVDVKTRNQMCNYCQTRRRIKIFTIQFHYFVLDSTRYFILDSFVRSIQVVCLANNWEKKKRPGSFVAKQLQSIDSTTTCGNIRFCYFHVIFASSFLTPSNMQSKTVRVGVNVHYFAILNRDTSRSARKRERNYHILFIIMWRGCNNSRRNDMLMYLDECFSARQIQRVVNVVIFRSPHDVSFYYHYRPYTNTYFQIITKRRRHRNVFFLRPIHVALEIITLSSVLSIRRSRDNYFVYIQRQWNPEVRLGWFSVGVPSAWLSVTGRYGTKIFSRDPH